MHKNKEQNKLTSIAIKQNLLLWQISQSFLDLDEKIKKSINKQKEVNC